MMKYLARLLILPALLLAVMAVSVFSSPATSHAQSIKPHVAGDPILVTWKVTTVGFPSDYSIYTNDAGGTHYIGTAINSTDGCVPAGTVMMDVNGTNGNYQGTLTEPVPLNNGCTSIVWPVHGGTRSGNILTFQTSAGSYPPAIYLTLT